MMMGTTIFVNMYIILNTDSISVLVNALKILNNDLFVFILIMLLYDSLVEISDTKLNIGSWKFVIFLAEHCYETDREARPENCLEPRFYYFLKFSKNLVLIILYEHFSLVRDQAITMFRIGYYKIETD